MITNQGKLTEPIIRVLNEGLDFGYAGLKNSLWHHNEFIANTLASAYAITLEPAGIFYSKNATAEFDSRRWFNLIVHEQRHVQQQQGTTTGESSLTESTSFYPFYSLMSKQFEQDADKYGDTYKKTIEFTLATALFNFRGTTGESVGEMLKSNNYDNETYSLVGKEFRLTRGINAFENLYETYKKSTMVTEKGRNQYENTIKGLKNQLNDVQTEIKERTKK